MLVIGVVGGVACGKSLVAQQFEQLGAGRLDADLVGHEALGDVNVKQAILQAWGPDVFDPQGQVDRRALAARVFAPSPDGPAQLARLERITHPIIEQALRGRLAELREQGAPAAALDAAVLMKAGWDRLCDTIVFVDVPAAMRLERARTRGWTEAEWSAREAAQTPLEEKRRKASIVIDNSGSPEETRMRVEAAWKTLVSPSHVGPWRR
jgi:dephospho-CoA kinase